MRFRRFQNFPLEVQNLIISFSENTNCLSVSKNFYEFFLVKTKERNTKKGRKLLKKGCFFGLILSKGMSLDDKIYCVAKSGNLRLLEKIILGDDGVCFGYSQHIAMFEVAKCGNFSLCKKLRKKYCASRKHAFEGSVVGRKNKKVKYWWKRIKQDFYSKQEKESFLGRAVTTAVQNQNFEILPFFLKLGATNFVDAIEILCNTRNLEVFSMCVKSIKTPAYFDGILSASIRTQDIRFVQFCLSHGMLPERHHVISSQHFKDKEIFFALL